MEEKKKNHDKKIWKNIKTIGICSILFIGMAFSVMTFHVDADIHRLFCNIYYQFTGKQSSGFTILEISYSIGIGAGAVFFFGHFGKIRLSDEPTPIEEEMLKNGPESEDKERKEEI